jgi:glutathione S-transferase
MSDFVIYTVPGSPFARAVQLGLEEKGASYEIRAMGPGELKGEAHLQRNPFGRIPVFSHGDFQLYETQAILRYLNDLIPSPPLVPADPRAAARMNQIIGINDWYFFPKVAAVIVFQRFIGPRLLGLPADEAAIAGAEPDGRVCIAELDRLLGDQPFMAGDQLSLADLVTAPQLDFLAATPEGEAMLRGTRLAAWLTRMNARPSMIATQRPELFRVAA